MATGSASDSILVLCDHDALFTAIELALTVLPGIHVLRLVAGAAADQPRSRPSGSMADLVIVATAALTSNPFTMLADAGLLAQVGETPILILSERPTRAETGDRITYLNFPFDMDQLTATVQAILNRCTEQTPIREHSHGQ
jgi:DNA-binding response OmpR family regulator